MNKIFSIVTILFILGNSTVVAQGKTDDTRVARDTIKSIDINPLTPAKASFYSAVIPGLGQAYNKKYWKIPLVYAGIGTSLYFYLDSKNKYQDFRNAYKRRLEGYTDDEFAYLDNSRLIAGQKFYQRNRDLSALFAVGIYILNIIDANVDASLKQFNIDNRLSVKPEIYQNNRTLKTNLGLTLNYNF